MHLAPIQLVGILTHGVSVVDSRKWPIERLFLQWMNAQDLRSSTRPCNERQSNEVHVDSIHEAEAPRFEAQAIAPTRVVLASSGEAKRLQVRRLRVEASGNVPEPIAPGPLSQDHADELLSESEMSDRRRGFILSNEARECLPVNPIQDLGEDATTGVHLPESSPTGHLWDFLTFMMFREFRRLDFRTQVHGRMRALAMGGVGKGFESRLIRLRRSK